MVPVGIADDGTLVVAAAIDYAYWDKAAAEFAQRKELKAKRRVLLVAGMASDRAKLEFDKAGWTLAADCGRDRVGHLAQPMRSSLGIRRPVRLTGSCFHKSWFCRTDAARRIITVRFASAGREVRLHVCPATALRYPKS